MSLRQPAICLLLVLALLGQGLGSAATAAGIAKPAPATAAPMPCDGEAPAVLGHQSDCSMACDSAPDDGRGDLPWAAAQRGPELTQADTPAVPPAYRLLAPPAAKIIRLTEPRAPPVRRAAATPVERADRLLT